MLTAQAAAADSFLRLLVSSDAPTDAGISSATGYGLVAGTRIGPKQEHEFSFECHHTAWNIFLLANAMYPVAGRETNTPLLLNYRYQFGAHESRIRFYAGPALGFTRVHLNIAIAYPTFAPGPAIERNVTDWSFTWSGSAGVLLRLADKADLDLGYRYLCVQDPNHIKGIANLPLDDRKINLFYAGIGFRF